MEKDKLIYVISWSVGYLMQLVLTGDFDLVREKYIDVIEHTKDMNIHARWIYGKHPTDVMLQSYIDRKEMYLFMDGQSVAGLTGITMYPGGKL